MGETHATTDQCKICNAGKRGGEFEKCQRSNLLETMLAPELPHLTHLGDAVIDFVPMTHYVNNIAGGIERVHIYFSEETKWPRRLEWEDVEKLDGGQEKVTPLLTFDLIDFSVVGPSTQTEWAKGAFELPGKYGEDPRGECERHVGGFPYVHVFHTFLKV